MIPVLGFCGASGSGKTTLTVKLISELSQRGFKVGAVKHHGHQGRTGQSGQIKDTHRLAAAGADPVALVHPGGVELVAGPDQADWTPLQVVRSYFSGMDLVLVEGFKTAHIDKIEVIAPGKEPWLPPGGRLLALAARGGSGTSHGLPMLDADDIPAMADFVERSIQSQVPAPSNVTLTVDGKEVELNNFVGAFLESTLKGLISTLKGGNRDGVIEVRIDNI